MFRLALSTLRSRKGALLATFVAVFLGATVVIACAGVLETGVRIPVPPQRLTAAPIVVTGQQTHTLPGGGSAALAERVRVDTDLVGALGRLPEVAAAVGDVSFPAVVLRDGQPLGADGQSSGHAWDSAQLMPYALTSGQAPDEGEVVLDATLARQSGARVDDRVQIASGGTVEQFRVAGVAAPSTDTQQQAMFFSAAHARELFGRAGQVDAIGVFPAPGTDVGQLRQRVEGVLEGQPAVVLTGDDRGLAEFPQAQGRSLDLIVIAGVFGGMAIIVALFGVAATLALSIQERGREMALLRAVGATGRQLRRLVVGETLIVAVLATALATPAGLYVGRWLFQRLVDGEVIPSAIAFRQSWPTVLAAIALTLVAAIAAAFVAGRRAALTRPVEALVEADLQRQWFTRTRLLLSILCFVAATSLVVVTLTVMSGPLTASTAGQTSLWLLIGLALLGPGIARVMTGLLGRPLSTVSRAAGYLARLNTQARTVRTAAVITPVMFFTGLATANIYLGTTEVRANQRAYSENLVADAVLTSGTGGFAPDMVDHVRQVPGVAAASDFVTSVGYVENPSDGEQTADGWQLQGVSADGVEQTAPVSLTAGTLDDLRGDTVALSAAHASRLGRGVGDTITVRLGDGTAVDLRVVALFEARPSFETILLPGDLLAPHTTDGLPDQIMVRAEPGTDTAQLTAALWAVAAQQPGTAVTDRSALTEVYAENVNTQVLAGYLVVGVIVAYSAIALVNTLAMSTARRRREFGLQRITGSTPGQVLRMVTAEGLLIAVTGIVLGTVAALTTLVPFSLARSDSLMPSGPLWIYLAVIGSACVLTLVAMLLPTWLTLRQRPVEAVAVAE